MTTHKLVDVDMLAVKQGTYRQGVASALRDPNLLAISRMRRRQASQVMVALDHDGMKTKIPPGPYFISLKIDGEFTVMAYKDGDIISVNPYGTVRMGAPFHIELGKMLAKAGIKSAILGGELWVKHADGHRPRVHDVTRLARAPQSPADVDQLHYAVFAIYDLDGVDLSTQPGPQLAKIRAIFANGKHVKPIETHEGSDAEIQTHFKKWVVDGGEEGIVARSEKFGWFKIKPRHSLDVAVIGFSEAIEDRAGMLHSLLLAVVRGDGSYHVVGRTGGGFSDAERVQLLKDLSQRTAESTYIEVNSDRVAYKMLQPGLVAEISCLDVITEFADGEPIERMVIEWDASCEKMDQRPPPAARQHHLAAVRAPARRQDTVRRGYRPHAVVARGRVAGGRDRRRQHSSAESRDLETRRRDEGAQGQDDGAQAHDVEDQQGCGLRRASRVRAAAHRLQSQSQDAARARDPRFLQPRADRRALRRVEHRKFRQRLGGAVDDFDESAMGSHVICDGLPDLGHGTHDAQRRLSVRLPAGPLRRLFQE